MRTNKYHNASKIVKQRLASGEPMNVPKEVYSSKQLTSSEKWVYVAILSLTDKDGECYATNGQIGERLGLGRETVGQSVVNIAKKGYIETDRFCTERNPDTNATQIRQIKIIKSI